jgi:hypothetical protein
MHIGRQKSGSQNRDKEVIVLGSSLVGGVVSATDTARERRRERVSEEREDGAR